MRPADAEAALRAGRKTRRTLTPFTDTDPALDEQWSYPVQALDRTQRTSAGKQTIGTNSASPAQLTRPSRMEHD